MKEFKEWKWLLKTNKGDFFMTVYGRWTQEEAANKVQLWFGSLNTIITGMIPRKWSTSPKEMRCSILEAFELERALPPPFGFEFIGGKKWWQAFGVGVLYEAKLILLRKGGS